VSGNSTLISMDRVTRLYGDVIGVNDISLELAPGAYGLLGPNGAGKTTLLNVITGRLHPTMGSINIMGFNPWNNADFYRLVGMCPSVSQLYPNISAYDWVFYLLKLQGRSSSQAKKEAEQALDFVKMTAAMHRKMGEYSRGMQQRTKLAQAIAHDPDLLILDEPFSGLDPIGRHDLTELLKHQIKRGKSIILASHILHEVEAVTDSFLLIYGGRLLASGSAAEVHAMLVDVPSEISLKCSDPDLLSVHFVADPAVESVQIDRKTSTLTVSTKSPKSFYESLSQRVKETGTSISEVRSSDESLQDLFDSLMRIHRGET